MSKLRRPAAGGYGGTGGGTRGGARGGARGNVLRGVEYASSPLLASKTPPWRSKLLVAFVGASFCVLLGRAVYVQIIDAPFFLRQGEARYARTLELPASRGRILDRNGLILAASIPVPSLWAIPKDMDSDPAERARLAKPLRGARLGLLIAKLRRRPLTPARRRGPRRRACT